MLVSRTEFELSTADLVDGTIDTFDPPLLPEFSRELNSNCKVHLIHSNMPANETTTLTSYTSFPKYPSISRSSGPPAATLGLYYSTSPTTTTPLDSKAKSLTSHGTYYKIKRKSRYRVGNRPGLGLNSEQHDQDTAAVLVTIGAPTARARPEMIDVDMDMDINQLQPLLSKPSSESRLESADITERTMTQYNSLALFSPAPSPPPRTDGNDGFDVSRRLEEATYWEALSTPNTTNELDFELDYDNEKSPDFDFPARGRTMIPDTQTHTHGNAPTWYRQRATLYRLLGGGLVGVVLLSILVACMVIWA